MVDDTATGTEHHGDGANQIKNIENWKPGNTIRIYTRITDAPFPFAPLIDPIRLFGIYYGKDGSLYTENYAPAIGATYERYENGQRVLQQEIPVNSSTKLKTSFHGSGEVVGFERVVEDWPRAHLGYVLRDIDEPRLLAEQHIGTAGYYIGRFEESPPPTTRSVLVPGLFETVDAPVFSIWAAPEGFGKPEGTVVSATTQLLSNGRRLIFHIALKLLETEKRPSDHHQRTFTAVTSHR